jgi:hypothetical protein
MVLAQYRVVGSVLLGASDDEHAARAARARRIENVLGSFDVDAQRTERVAPRLRDVGTRGQVVDDLGL